MDIDVLKKKIYINLLLLSFSLIGNDKNLQNQKFTHFCFYYKIVTIMEIFIDRPDQLLKQVWNDKNIHIVQKQYSLGRDRYCLIDISMNAQGLDEDKIFIDSAFYRTNIRRGNTLIEVTDKGKKKIIWGRKGTQKIIDIRLQLIESVTRGLNLNKDQKKTFQYIFRNVNKCFESGKRVELLKTQKANGENAQVSYCYDLDAWIICSKNVSMIATCLEDLQIYDGKRYSYAKVIARQWFKEIEHLQKQKIRKLKKLLDGFTLVGQYCGNPQYQHLILYNEIKIIWFGLIDNFTEEYCIDPFQVRKDIEEFGFSFVKVKRMGSWNDKKKFYQQLQDLFLKIAQSSMQDQQYGLQGSIVYFVSPEFKNNKPHTKVLGSGKLKTIQYRFFRKIRQKLSRYINRKQSQPQLVRKYELQCKELQKSNNSQAPYPQFYYTQILKKGCELIRQTKITQEILRSKFVSILKLLFYVIYKNINLKNLGNKLIKNEQFLNQVTKIPLSSYGTMGCNTKIIFVPIGLPFVVNEKLSEQISNHLKLLNLPFKQIQCQNLKDDIQKIFTAINSDQNKETKNPFLVHYYLNGFFKFQEINSLLQKLKYKGKRDTYHQIILIKDFIPSDENCFEDSNQTEYPFRFQTILLSYWKAFQQVKNTPTIQEKIDILKTTTEILLRMKDFPTKPEKKEIRRFNLQMSGKTKIEENQESELIKIISAILNSQKEYENYCRLILKLDKTSQNIFNLPNEQQLKSETKQLIRGTFPIVPQIDFVKKQQ